MCPAGMSDAPIWMLALLGARPSTVTIASPNTGGSVTLVARTVTVPAVAPAVNNPAGEITPRSLSR